MQFSAVDLFNSLKIKLPELKAIVLVGAAGEFNVQAAPHLSPDAETFAAEYATLFRIALRTAQDTAIGVAFEQILISDKAILVMRRYGAGNIAVFISGPDQHLGRLRFEIRSLAEYLPVSVI